MPYNNPSILKITQVSYIPILINEPQILESLIATLMMDNRFGILNKEKIKENLEILFNKRIITIKKKKSIIWHLTLLVVTI